MKILYSNGCSQTEGQELGNEKFGYFEKTGEHRSNRRKLTLYEMWDHLRYMEENCWPNLLREKLNIGKTVNRAISGSSNKRIVRTTITDVSELLKSNRPEDILVVIGWTGFTRLELVQDGHWCQVVYPMSKTRSVGITNPLVREYAKKRSDILYTQLPLYLYEYLKDINTLRFFLESKKVPYYFTSCVFEPIKDLWPQDHIDFTKSHHDLRAYFDITDFSDRFILFWDFPTKREEDVFSDFVQNGEFRSLNGFILKGNYPVGVGFHPLEDGHKDWATFLYGEINKRNM